MSDPKERYRNAMRELGDDLRKTSAIDDYSIGNYEKLKREVEQLKVQRDMLEAELSSGVARVNELEAELAALKGQDAVLHSAESMPSARRRRD